MLIYPERCSQETMGDHFDLRHEILFFPPDFICDFFVTDFFFLPVLSSSSASTQPCLLCGLHGSLALSHRAQGLIRHKI